MKMFRRFRGWCAAVAILFSPGVLAPWLQLAHACPTLVPAAPQHRMAGMDHMPGMAMDVAMPMADHPPAGEGHGAPSHGSHPCTCIGACHLLAAVALPRLAVLPVPVAVAAPRSLFVPAATLDLVPPTQLHPPATAPPVFA